MKSVKKTPAIVNPYYSYEGEQRLKLSGIWRFRLDPEDVGLKEKWYENDYAVLDSIDVPGTWQGQGFGSDEKETHKEFGLDIRAFKATYEGTGWYKKSFTVPEEYAGKRLWLNFGGVAPTSEVWLNGVKLGENHEPLVPFAFDITEFVKPGENTITVRISEEDRMMCLTYYYCGKWSGIYRDVELTATGEACIDRFSAVPDVDGGKIAIDCAISDPAKPATLKIKLFAPGAEEPVITEAAIENGVVKTDVVVENAHLWSPEDPALYRIEVLVIRDGEIMDGQCHRVGFVKLVCADKRFMINGKPYYARGCGDFGEMPETVAPNTDREHWKRCLQTLRDYGYLYVRCQTFVPVPEYFDMADEVGLLIQSEAGTIGPICGHSYYHTYNQYPKPTADYRERFREQWNHIVERDVCHPSANIYCMSNEIRSTNCIEYPHIAHRCYDETKAIKPTALVIWTDGGYSERMPGDFVNDEAKWCLELDKPVIQHEFKWWSSFPDIELIPKYRNLPTRPFAELIAMEEATKKGISHILPQAAKNSQILQFLEAKCKLESLRRDYPLLAGICHFNAVDTGLSKQGIVNMFYEKKYADAALWQMTNGDTVILTSLNFNDRCYASGEKFSCNLFVSDYSHPTFEKPTLEWAIQAGEEILAAGSIDYAHEAYTTCPAGAVEFEVPDIEKPMGAWLKAKLTDGERTVVNQWRIWFFPKKAALPEDAMITDTFDEKTVEFIRNGGNVLLKATGEGFVRPYMTLLGLNTGRYFFTRPANFPPFEELQDGTIIKDHPMLGDFPHEDYADVQFYNMIGESPAIDLEPLGLLEDDPVIRMIHSYYVSRPLGYLLERSIGKGRLILCSLDLDSGRTEADYFLNQICKYMVSNDMQECPELTDIQIERLVSASTASNYGK